MSLEQIVQAARRKMLLAYVLRQAGWCALATSAAAGVSAVLGLGLLLPGIALLLAIAVALIYGSPPDQFRAALELDRQWRLKELLSSAQGGGNDESFAQAVRVQAQRAAAEADLERFDAGRVGVGRWAAALLLLGVAMAFYEPPQPTWAGRSSEVAAQWQPRDADERASQPRLSPKGMTQRGSGGMVADESAAGRVGEIQQRGASEKAISGGRSESASAGSGGGLAVGDRAMTEDSVAGDRRAMQRGLGEETGAATGAGDSAGGSHEGKPGGGLVNRQRSDVEDAPIGSSSPRGDGAGIRGQIPSRYRALIERYYGEPDSPG